MKKTLLILMSLILIICLAGCKVVSNNGLHFYTRPHGSYRENHIIYEIYADPLKVIDGYYFEKNDITLIIKYGWNEAKIEDLLNRYKDRYELICFASYICLEQYSGVKIRDDYKNLENSFLLEEIDKEIFLSDYYKANFGKMKSFKRYPPIFSEENEGFKLKLTPEYINWLEESTERSRKTFYFSVVPIYYNSIDKKYVLNFYGRYDRLEIAYQYDKEKNLVQMSAS